MPAAYRSAGAIAATETPGDDIGVTTPAGFQAGDILVVVCWTGLNNDFVDPAGWTVLAERANASSGTSWIAYWRRAVGGDSGPRVSTTGDALGAGNGLFGRMYAFEKAHLTDAPVDPEMSNNVATTDVAVSANHVTTADNSLAVVIAFFENDIAWASGHPPSGWTSTGALATSTVAGDAASGAMTRLYPTAGAVGAVDMGDITPSVSHSTLIFSLKPSVVGDTVQLVWNDRAAVGDTINPRWNVRAKLGDTVQLVWRIAARLWDTLQLVWSGDSFENVITYVRPGWVAIYKPGVQAGAVVTQQAYNEVWQPRGWIEYLNGGSPHEDFDATDPTYVRPGWVLMEHPDITDPAKVTQEAFDTLWAPLGWTEV